ncbi:MAG: AMIN domain-containing protein [Desulfobulbaceae bacterium]|nr:AMIN domain-containing protein [Desulfobulbaceae bacterium]
MIRFSFNKKRMGKLATRFAGHYIHALLIVLASFTLVSAGSGSGSVYTVKSITVDRTGNSTQVRIKGDGEPTYNPFELHNPFRIVIEITNSVLSPDFKYNSPEGMPLEYSARVMEDVVPTGMHLEFGLDNPIQYNTYIDENDIVILMEMVEGAPLSSSSAGATMAPEVKNGQGANNTSKPVSSNAATALTEIKVNPALSQLEFTIVANGLFPKYQYHALEKSKSGPARLYFDFDGVDCSELLKEQDVGSVVSKIRVSKKSDGARIVFDSASDNMFSYTINEQKDRVTLTVKDSSELDGMGSTIEKKVSKANLDDQLPTANLDKFAVDKKAGSNRNNTSLPEEKSDIVKKMEDSFGFAGYSKEKITVDFYKIDIHNVFRLMREISGANLIVDSGVSGTLTLQLKDVPWDFALDLIINVMNLQKDERYNTIVILPKTKQFIWPERAEDNLSFEADPGLAGKESIVIQQQLNLPPEVINAKKIIGEAVEMANKGEYETAIAKYKDAFALWPDNAELANLISSIYLVKLNQNANAAFFAKKALEIEPANNGAALNAAISLANMHNYNEARVYFDQAVSSAKPKKEALMSYAVFAEQQEHHDAAIKLIQKHNALYGNNVDSMLAEARLLDKMGKYSEATDKYTSILLSGFHIPMDLRKYINGRVSAK